MKLKFDANLKYQLDAIQSVTDLFKGQPSAIGTQQVFGRLEGDLQIQINELGIGNPSRLHDHDLLKNLRAIQDRNLLPQSPSLMGYIDVDKTAYPFPNFSVEAQKCHCHSQTD